MDYETIILEKKDHVARFTLNRPERLNALNEQMFMELNSALEDVASDREVRALVLTGAGRAFCSSADIKDERQGRRPAAGTHGTLRDSPVYPQRAAGRYHQAPQDGSAHHRDGQRPGHRRRVRLGAGLRHPHRLASAPGLSNAFLQMGLVSNTGGTWLYPRALGVSRALELLYTGDRLEAEDALRLGVLNHLAPSGRTGSDRRWPWPPKSPGKPR